MAAARGRRRRGGNNRGGNAARGGGRLVGGDRATVRRRNVTLRQVQPGGALANAVTSLRTNILRPTVAVAGRVRNAIARVLRGGTNRSAPRGTSLGVGTRAPSTRSGISGTFRFTKVGTPAQQRAYQKRYTYWVRQRAKARASGVRGAIGRVEAAARAEGMQGFSGGGI